MNLNIKDYIEFLEIPNLEKWMDKIKDYAEVIVTNCSICEKEIKGDFNTKIVKHEMDGYVCSSRCRTNFIAKAM